MYSDLPDEITEDWILRQDYPRCALVNYVIDRVYWRKQVDESQLPLGLYRLRLLNSCEFDVVNGGFEQFLCNAHSSIDGSDLYLSDTQLALNALGLHELEQLVLESIDVLKSPDSEGSSKEDRYESLFERFDALNYAYHARLDQYIREHPTEFVWNPSHRRTG